MNNKTILIATKNKHKAAELAALLSPLAETMNLADWEAKHDCILTEPEENGQTFQENALIKARAYARAWERLTGEKVSETGIYFFHVDAYFPLGTEEQARLF